MATLGLYQVVDAQWNFVVSCDWQCRPLDEQTTFVQQLEQLEQPRQSTAVAPPPETMDENEAQIGLFVCFFFFFFVFFSFFQVAW